MSYYLRYIVSDTRPITLTALRDGLAGVDRRYRWDLDGTEGALYFEDVLLARVELNMPGDGLFDEERDELIEFAEGVQTTARVRVLAALREARAIVAAQVLYGTGDAESALKLLDPIWSWLFTHRAGLLHADGEGYYDQRGRILAVP